VGSSLAEDKSNGYEEAEEAAERLMSRKKSRYWTSAGQ
jgi:hypothetical protein